MQRMWLYTLVKVNLQVVEIKGEFGVSEVGVGGSSCANSSELVSEQEKGWW